MGLKSFVFRQSGAAKQLENRKAELKSKLAATRAEVASLKEELRLARLATGQPPPRSPALEKELSDALAELRNCSAPSIIPAFDQVLARVQIPTSEYDIMIKKSTPNHYVRVGVSALEAMHRAAPELANQGPTRILDFGCGFGRVARFMTAAWPEAGLTICDVDFAGLAFCMAHLGMRGFPVGVDPTKMNLGTGYDLIWVGSVVTHLNSTLIHQLLTALTEALAPGGRLFFTAHGDHPAAMMKNGRPYDLTPEDMAEVVSGYEQTGFGYADYPHTAGYGVSLTSEKWIKSVIDSIPNLKCFAHEAKGWAEHQDLVGCVKEG